MVVTGGINHKKRQGIEKLQEWTVIYKKKSIHECQEKNVGFKRKIKKHGLIFHCNIRADPMLGLGYFFVRQIPYSCYECLRKLYYPLNRRQDQ